MTIRLEEIIKIIKSGVTNEHDTKISRLLTDIFANRGSEDDFYEGERTFVPTQKEELAQSFTYEWRIFGRKNIPWHEWSDIAEEGLNLLKDFIESDLQDYKELPGYSNFMLKVGQRINKLINSDKYDDEFHEWGKDD